MDALGNPRKGNAPDNWKERFVVAYAKLGSVRHAAAEAGVDRRTVQHHRSAVDAMYDENFDTACKYAKEDYLDSLEEEAYRRAVEGVDEPVYYQGKDTGRIRRYSDALLIFLLKGGRPEKFRDNATVQHSGPDGGPIVVKDGLSDEERATRLIALFDTARARRSGPAADD